MRRISWLIMSLVIAALIQVPAGFAAEPASEAAAQQIPVLTHAEAISELKRLQSEQDRVKQQASSADRKSTRLNSSH